MACQKSNDNTLPSSVWICMNPCLFIGFQWIHHTMICLECNCLTGVLAPWASCVFRAHTISALVLGDILNSDISRSTKPMNNLDPQMGACLQNESWDQKAESHPVLCQLQVLIGWHTFSTLCMYPRVATGILSVDLQTHFGKQMGLRHGSHAEWSCEILEMIF